MSQFINDVNIATLNIKVPHYCCIVSLISKNEAVNLMLYADLIEKKAEHYKT